MKQFLGNKRSGTPENKSDLKGNMVKDPICGMYMDPRLAVKLKMSNGVFYFCSEECKNKFLSIPPGKSPEGPTRDA
jgi:YHS domain-containing protein